jgi:hypothetical protein
MPETRFDPLRDFTTDAVRRAFGGQAIEQAAPNEPGSPGWYPLDHVEPRTATPEPDAAEEGGADEPADGRLPKSELEAWADAAVGAHGSSATPSVLEPDAPAENPLAGMTARDFVDLAIANGAEDLLGWAASCPPEAWADYCAESGWPVGQRPAWRDLPTALRTDLLRDELEAENARIRDGGRRVL